LVNLSYKNLINRKTYLVMIIKVLIPLLLLIALPTLLAQAHKENVSGPFENAKQVTEECLMCHKESGEEILQSRHWNWLGTNEVNSDTSISYGNECG
jgi:hypothetical protein